MKIDIKSSYLLLLSAVALSSCSQEDFPDVTEGDGNRILFRTSLPELTTRADIIYKHNLPYFNVTAFDFDDPTRISNGKMTPLFCNERIDVTEGQNTFSSPNCCWPEQTMETHKVKFFGYYPGPTDVDGAEIFNGTTPYAVDYKMIGFRVDKEIENQLDFVAAYTEGTMADNLFSGVNLPFCHKLSRIEIKAYGAHKSCDIEIAGVRIGGIGIEDTFDFKPIDDAGYWLGNTKRGIVEYIFREGDKVVTCGKNNRVGYDDAFSIMGKQRKDGSDNSAMLIPAQYTAWDAATDPHNDKNRMYISVLLRITDATTTAGINPVEKQRYPYRDLSQGDNSLKIPVEYFAVNKTSGEVSTRLYKDGDQYFTDVECKSLYSLPASEEIKEFGWAALPVEGNWEPGNIYTYYLDYTVGVGLHDPAVTTTGPGAGDPVISDRVGITYTVKKWENGGGDNFEVPGS